jgi:hypothetical protein
MFPFPKMPGIIPTKLYDYLFYSIQILFYKKVNGKIDELLEETQLGIIGNTENEIISSIVNIQNISKFDNDNIAKYSRESNCIN